MHVIGSGSSTRAGLAGVMNASYARARTTKPALVFRLRARAEIVVRAVRRYGFGGSLQVLEVGAADGRTLVELSKHLGRGPYWGVEYDRDLLSSHPPLPAGVELVQGDAHALPDSINDASFDVVSMLALLEHLDDPTSALGEARRVLKPGGLIVATCPNPFWDGIAGRLGLVNDDHHVNRIDLPRLRTLVRASGFDVLESGRFMWAPVASLPYAHVPVHVPLAAAIDRIISALPAVRRLCVNAYVVAQRPT